MKGMIKKYYHYGIIVFTAAALLLAAACQNNAPAPKAETDLNTSAPQQAAEAEQPIQLVYWHTLTGMASSAQDELAEAFNASQNRIRVASEFQGSFYSEIGTKLLAAYGSGNAPEVSQLGTYEVGPFVEAGALVDLTPFIRSQDGLDIEDFPASILAAGEVDGGIYWLPFNIAVPLLYYNQEAFNEAGITSPPQTWDEFFEAARKLTKRDENGNTTRYGVAYWDISWPMLSAVWSQGGELMDKSTQQPTLNSPIIAETLKPFQDLVKEGAAIIPDKASGGHRAAFKNGKAAMIFDSPSPYAEIISQSVGFTPNVAPLPAGKKGKIYAPGAGGLVMLSTTPPEKRAAAWQFIKFMLSPKSLAEYCKKTGYIAYYPEAQEEMGEMLQHPHYAAMYSAVPFVRWDFSLYRFPPARDGFEEAWQKIFFDLADIPSTLEAANQKAIQQKNQQ